VISSLSFSPLLSSNSSVSSPPWAAPIYYRWKEIAVSHKIYSVLCQYFSENIKYPLFCLLKGLCHGAVLSFKLN
jgi:hypothetical protein